MGKNNASRHNLGLPLSGVRVVDLTRLLPGNFCTLVLSLLGADVIKVEDPNAGDYQRGFGYQVDGAGACHHVVNRGKRSIIMDLKNPSDKEDFERLVKQSDVLVESFRPGVMDRLGLSCENLQAQRPELVFASISGYGATGPMAGDVGHDINYLAFAGLLDRIGRVDGPPVVPAIPLADLIGGGLLPALLIVAYLQRARATGHGAFLDCSMADSVALMPSLVIADILAGGDVPGRGEIELGGALACYDTYRVRDGYVVVGALEERFWHVVCDVVGLPEFRDEQRNGDLQVEIRSRLSAFFAGLTRKEVSALFENYDACVTPVLSYEEMLESPQAKVRGFVDSGAGHPFPMLAFPAMVDGHRLPEPGPAPSHGEHSDEIRRELAKEGALQDE